MTTNQSELQAPKRQIKIITIQEKLAILEQLEAGHSRRAVEQMFNCSQSTISRVLSGKELLKQGTPPSVYKPKEGVINYKELDHALSQWARDMKMSGEMFTANEAKQKAEELARAMGHDWIPSTAWLYKWKERENIKFARKSKDPEEIIKEYLEKQEKIQQMERLKVGSYKELKMVNEESKTDGTEENPENSQNEILPENLDDSQNKPRMKREYTKRMPIIDANGVVHRSRKGKTFLTLLQKLDILQRMKNGERKQDLAMEYTLSQSAMSQLINDEKKILQVAAGGQNLQMKRIRNGIFKDGEAELNAWVNEKMEKGESLTRTHIKNHAKEIAERLNIDFKASTGWLEKWKARMNLDFNQKHVLERKIVNYNMANEEEFDNSHEYYEQADVSYDQQSETEEVLPHQQIKTEITEYDYDEDMETQDEFCYDDVKPELLTPQQFYIQTIRADSQTSQNHNAEPNQPEEERDIKPFIGTPPHLKEPAENLHDQVLNWLNRYSIPPHAASELLDILQPHLNAGTNNVPSSLPVQRKQQYI